MSMYKELEQYEVSMQVPTVQSNESIIVRLDGKGLTARFKSDTELFLADFHLAMKRVMEGIKKYCPYVRFAYSFKDEVSLKAHIFQIRPLFYADDFFVKIVYLRSPHREEKRRVGRYDHLATEIPCRIL